MCQGIESGNLLAFRELQRKGFDGVQSPLRGPCAVVVTRPTVLHSSSSNLSPRSLKVNRKYLLFINFAMIKNRHNSRSTLI